MKRPEEILRALPKEEKQRFYRWVNRFLQKLWKELYEEKIPMKFGLYTVCEFGDYAPEPEGTVIYDKLPPDIGTEVVLSDGKVWVVVRFEEYNSTVYVQPKKEKNNE